MNGIQSRKGEALRSTTIGLPTSDSTTRLQTQPNRQTTRTLTGRLCVLRRGRGHVVLIRPNSVQFGHLGLELMFGVRLAKRFRASLHVIRPDEVVNTALYELVADNVTINVVKGWRATLLTWAFFSGSALNVKDKPVPYASPIGYLLTYRFFRLNHLVAKGFWNKVVPVLKQGNKYARIPIVLAHVVRRRLIAGRMVHATDSDRGLTSPDAASSGDPNNLSLTAESSVAAEVVEQPIKIPKSKPTRLNPSYGRRLWVDDIGLFRIPSDRLPSLGSKAENEFGILPGTPLVALHMREPGFKAGREIHEQKPFKGRDDSTRNVTFCNYHLAMDYLRDLGYTVVRIGDRTMTPMRYPGIIDVATSPNRTDLFEFYCVACSDFFIGCESGPSIIAWMSGKPIVTLNATEPWSLAYPVREFDTFILKPAWDKLNARTVGPLEMLTRDYANNARNTQRFEYIENSPEDVLDAIRDMVEIVAQGVKPETPEQRAFRLRVMGFCTRARSENSTVRKHGAHHGFIGRGRISPSFARKYIAPQLKQLGIANAPAELFVGAA
jgi:putative glycosyltransferase (TIGR04372 family)